MNISQNMREGAIRVSLGWGSNKEEVKNFISFFENLFNKTAKE
jgi:cysteine sulfinate desulfinase/cysteine desulfurase-like protein